MKYYPTIEQSRKLLELGLNPESADMCYFEQKAIITPYNEAKDSLLPLMSRPVEVIPCWSVGALIELMPSGVRISKNCDGNYDLGYENFDTKEYLYMIDACFEMTVWFLENGYLKKGE